MNTDLHIYYKISISNKKKEIEKELFKLLSKNFNIEKFVDITLEKESNEEKNVIKKGITCFKTIWKTQKLKSTKDMWFIFVGKGDIPKVYSNVKMIFISKNPILGPNKLYYSLIKSEKKIKNVISDVFKNKPLEYNLNYY
jgi:hypothetical protein